MDLTIVTDELERELMNKVMDGHVELTCNNLDRALWEDESEYPRKQWLDVLKDEPMPFLVVDNREGDCWVEQFDTLDGAMLYACDIYMTCEEQIDWDYPGAVKDHGGLEEDKVVNRPRPKEEFVVKCPVRLTEDGLGFEFDYLKKVDPGAPSDAVWTSDIGEAIKFQCFFDAQQVGRKMLPNSFRDKNVSTVAREKEELKKREERLNERC